MRPGWSCAALVVVLVAVFPAVAHALAFDPPGWWSETRSLLEQRGGHCEPKTEQVSEPSYVQNADSWTEQRTECRHTVPRSLFVSNGGNPAAPDPGEWCVGIASDGRNRGDEYDYQCEIVADAGPAAAPHSQTWWCYRDVNFNAHEGKNTSDDVWKARANDYWPENRWGDSLATCIAPRATARLAARDAGFARRAGLSFPARCSRRCDVEITLTRAGRVVGRGRASLPAWTGRSVTVPLTAAAASASRLTVRLAARMSGLSGRDSAVARLVSGKWRFTTVPALDAALSR